jgi:hypothetical protein
MLCHRKPTDSAIFSSALLYAVFLDGVILIAYLQGAEQYPQAVNRARMFFLAW